MKLDRATRLEMLENWRALPVVRIGVPNIVGFRRDGTPIWEIGGAGDTNNYRSPLMQPPAVDLAAITLSTTQKMLWTPGVTSPTILPANFWSIGKAVKLTAFLKVVTAATPGNFTYGMAYGAADAPAANVVGVARAAVAAVTVGAMMEGYAVARTLGSAGTLSMWGKVSVDLAGMLSTSQPILFPSGGTTVVSTIDTTVATNGVYFQAARSGSTAETIQAVGLVMEAVN
jgi:hypothetical protein